MTSLFILTGPVCCGLYCSLSLSLLVLYDMGVILFMWEEMQKEVEDGSFMLVLMSIESEEYEF